MGASYSELLGTTGKAMADWSLQKKLNIARGTGHRWHSSFKDNFYGEYILPP